MKTITVEVDVVARHRVRVAVERPDDHAGYGELNASEVWEVEKKADERTHEWDFEQVREVKP